MMGELPKDTASTYNVIQIQQRIYDPGFTLTVVDAAPRKYR